MKPGFTNKPLFTTLLAQLIIITVAMMFSFSANAASCKGISKSSCSANSSCNWVEGYKRKDGIKVSGHCRAASGKANKDKKVKKAEKKTEKKVEKKAKKKTETKKKTNSKKNDAKKKLKSKKDKKSASKKADTKKAKKTKKDETKK